ncbi:MAG: DUF1778 domain-containing protein [Dehalococcoidia bacterium]|nr:DUF1778 domain-containing protein [Dehalococcoidia bacterium]
MEARITPEQKALFQRAASITGRSLSDFVVASLQEAATEAIRSNQVLELTERETQAFASALLNPPAPNEILRAGAGRYRELVDRT